MSLDINKIRNLFPILHQEVNGKPLVYFDNAATTQKPIAVIEALKRYYEGDNSNIHRGAHTLAARSTGYFENTRTMVRDIIHAKEADEIIFTKGTTEGINLVACTFGRKFMKFAMGGLGNFLWSDYNAQWPLNPYKVLNVADIYSLDNGDLLFVGAIANDLQLPNEYRGISRLHADGSNDTTMPVLNITPNGASGAVRRIHRTIDGAFYISGRFSAINEHQTNHIARLNPDLTLDTTFVSPLVYNPVGLYSGDIILVDSLSRIWYSGHDVKLQQNPGNTFQLVRLQHTSAVDSSFALGYMNGFEDDGYRFIPVLAYHAQELEAHPGNYLLYGSFKYLNDTLQPCITVVNNDGSIQADFFQNQGAAASSTVWPPRVDVVIQTDEGSLLIGGRFSQFMGEARYSIVKLKAEM